MNRFTSRKFLLAVGAALTAIGSAISGSISWDLAIKAIIAVVFAYSAAEGAKDVVEATHSRSPELTPLGDSLVDLEEPTAQDYDLEHALDVFKRYGQELTPDSLRRFSEVPGLLSDLEIAAGFREINRRERLKG